MDKLRILFYFVAGAVPVLSIFLAIYTEIIRDISNVPIEKPYSLDRTQLLWWTTIIIFCYIWYYAELKHTPELMEQHMWLLGISVSTTVAARMIDKVEIKKRLIRHQDKPSQGFFYDILSDENGISIHRYQHFVFNIVFGLIFLFEFFSKYKFYNFSTQELTLMGISATAFITMKYNENS